MSLRVSLNGTLLADTPRGWDKASVRSKKDKTINGLFTEYTTDLEFWGDGFTIINDIIDIAYCSVIDILIESDDCEAGIFFTEFEGVVPITRLKLDVDEAIYQGPLLDEGYQARISNNKKIKAIVDTGKSKNGFDITPATAVNIAFYDPTEGRNSYSFPGRECYKAFDCFRFIIAHITDNTVGFESELLGIGGDLENLVILTGFELRQGSGNGEAPDVSFEDMFLEISKKKNLGFAIVPSGSGGFNVKVEEDAFFRSEIASKTYRNVRNIKMNFNLDKMYSNVTLGSQQYELATSLSFPPVRLKGFREENYTIQGECNIENELNLVSKWIVDSNTIEDVLTNGESEHDDINFLIETNGTQALKFDAFNIVRASGTTTSNMANKLVDTGAGFVVAGVTAGDEAVNQDTGLIAEVTAVDNPNRLSLDTDIFTAFPEDYVIIAPPFVYNIGLANFASIINWLGNIPNSIVKFFGDGDDNFRAQLTSNIVYVAFPAATNPIIFDDDSTPPNFDTNSNYDITNGQYAIPADGLYSFRANYLMSFLGELGPDVITNGDFSATTDWFIGSNIDWVINTALDQAIINTGRSSPTQVMFQALVPALPTDSKHILNFDIPTYFFGSVQVATSINGSNRTIHGTFNTVGTHQVNINIVGVHNRVEFIGIKDGSGAVNLHIDNVTLQAVPKFTVTTTITRANASLQALDIFNLSTGASLDFDLKTKRIEIEHFTSAFGAFQDNIVRASISIVDEVGAGTEVRLRGKSSYETTLVEDGGGELVGVDVDQFDAYRYEFEKELSISEFRDIVNNPEEAIVFNRSNDPDEDIIGWRESIELDRDQGIGKFTLVSKQKILPCSTS